MEIRKSIDLVEAASAVLYHYTSLYNAVEILKSGRFELSIASAKSDQMQPGGHFYFLSTARSLTGAFHSPTMRHGGSGVMFNLDGNWLNQRYRAKAVDYWGARQSHSEAEDRIFSRTDTMPIAPVTAIHVLADEDFFNDDGSFNHEANNSYDHLKKLEMIQKLAEQRNIPFFMYTNRRMWMLQAEKGHVKGFFKRYQYDLISFVELLEKNSVAELSDHARRLLNLIQKEYYMDEVARSINIDIHNGRKGDNRATIVKIFNFMRDHKIASIPDLLDFAATKFSPR